MAPGNKTVLTEFVLLGLSVSWEIQIFLFVLFFLLYGAAFFSNVLVLLAISQDPHLFNSPMFFFLGHLAFLDLCVACVIVPRTLTDFLTQCQVISFQDCMAQLFFLHLFCGSEMLMMIFMAYDRYIAICYPLFYTSLMSRGHCIVLVLASWTGGLLHTSVQLGFTINVPYCGPNQVDNFFCDTSLLIKLACADTCPLEVLLVTNNGIISLACFVALLLSYGLILSTIYSRGTSEGISKAISTCTSHLIVIIMYFEPCIFICLRPSTHFGFDKVLSVFSTVVSMVAFNRWYGLKS